MRFTYITIEDKLLHSTAIKLVDDNILTFNGPTTAPDCYFTCGDLVWNYDTASGEVLTVDGYIPYFDSLPRIDIAMPEDCIPGRILVGDLTEGVFATANLELEVSKSGRVLHAGEANSSSLYIKCSESIQFGLTNESITEIFLSIDAGR